MKLDEYVLDILGQCKVEDRILYLPGETLPRKTYLAVDQVLRDMGGKWDRKRKGHVFTEDPTETLDGIILTGEYTPMKKEFQFFETPVAVAEMLVDMAEIMPHERVLEPSAGQGRIAEAIRKKTEYVDCVEAHPTNRKVLSQKGFNVAGDDFMMLNGQWDVVVANPPFTRQQDIDHVTRMIDVAKRRVVSVMSTSIKFRTNKKTLDFQHLLARYTHRINDLPPGTFKESGTLVNTCVVVVDID